MATNQEGLISHSQIARLVGILHLALTPVPNRSGGR